MLQRQKVSSAARRAAILRLSVPPCWELLFWQGLQLAVQDIYCRAACLLVAGFVVLGSLTQTAPQSSFSTLLNR